MMELSNFLQSLLSEGKVTVQTTLLPFEQADLDRAKQILADYYTEDILEMPLVAPAFDPVVALWAAQYFYTAIQLTVMREAGEEELKKYLQPCHLAITPEAIYSADLCMRYLPALLDLVKGLAPSDSLVTALKKTAAQWPFSSVGILLDEIQHEEIILLHPSLMLSYADRIILKTDKKRITHQKILKNILEITGQHIEIVWPGFENPIN